MHEGIWFNAKESAHLMNYTAHLFQRSCSSYEFNFKTEAMKKRIEEAQMEENEFLGPGK